MSGLPPGTKPLSPEEIAELKEKWTEVLRQDYWNTQFRLKTGVPLSAWDAVKESPPKSTHEAKLQAYIKQRVKDAIKKGDL